MLVANVPFWGVIRQEDSSPTLIAAILAWGQLLSASLLVAGGHHNNGHSLLTKVSID